MRPWRSVLSDRTIGHAAKLLYMVLVSYDRDGADRPTNRQLAEDLGIIERNVQKALAELVEAGAIERKGVAHRHVAHRHVEHRHPLSNTDTSNTDTPLSNSDTPLERNLGLPSESESQPQSPPPPPDGGSGSDRGQPYRWAGTVIRLSELDYERWRKNFYAIDLPAQLQSLDDWMASECSEADRKRWFHRVSGALKNRHEAALTKHRYEGALTAEERRRIDEIPG
jgi:DNA-binding transcriptional MocR family regulator